jgi:hypothetical protein
MKIKNIEEYDKCIRNNFTGIVEDSDGENFISIVLFRYFKNGKYHREDGPTIEWVDGTKFWYLDGNLYTKKDCWEIERMKFSKQEVTQNENKKNT